MINYVNNSFDKVLKLCDAQQFMTLTRAQVRTIVQFLGEP